MTAPSPEWRATTSTPLGWRRKKGFVTLVANNYLQSEKDSGSWARDIVGALKTGDLEQVRKLLKVGTVFSSETGTINEFKVIWQEKLSSIMKMYICKTILLLIISNL